MKLQEDLKKSEIIQQYFGYAMVDVIVFSASCNADLEAHLGSDCCLTYIRGNVGLHAPRGASKAHIMRRREA